VSGVWHGAGYMFALWGLMHGVYLCINHAWRIFGPRPTGNRAPGIKSWLPGFLLTFVSIVVSMVLFRSATPAAAKSILAGMFGLHGIGLPQALFNPLASLAARSHGLVHVSTEMSATDLTGAVGWVIALLAAALALPNTLQILERYAPALSGSRPATEISWLRRALVWTPSLLWAIGLGALASVAVFRLGGQSEFLYWQF
jgi:alginate O-acetyltransferase complex protein AlgI